MLAEAFKMRHCFSMRADSSSTICVVFMKMNLYLTELLTLFIIYDLAFF